MKKTLIIVKCMGYLVDEIIGSLKETKKSIIDFYANRIQIFLQAKTTEEEIFHPMFIQFIYYRFLFKTNLKLILCLKFYQILSINQTTKFKPT